MKLAPLLEVPNLFLRKYWKLSFNTAEFSWASMEEKSENSVTSAAFAAIVDKCQHRTLSQYKWGFKCLFPVQVLAAQALPSLIVPLF